MLKKILKLEKTELLSHKEQKSINGGNNLQSKRTISYPIANFSLSYKCHATIKHSDGIQNNNDQPSPLTIC